MNTNEMDWRIGPLPDVIAGVETGLGRIRAKVQEESWYGGGHAMDDSESLLGIAFVAAQVYIEGTVGDLGRIRHGEALVGRRASDKFMAEWLARGGGSGSPGRYSCTVHKPRELGTVTYYGAMSRRGGESYIVLSYIVVRSRTSGA